MSVVRTVLKQGNNADKLKKEDKVTIIYNNYLYDQFSIDKYYRSKL